MNADRLSDVGAVERMADQAYSVALHNWLAVATKGAERLRAEVGPAS